MTLLTALLIVTTMLVVAMLRAERHARRMLFRKLEFSDDTIEFLMARNGDVRAELTLARILPTATPEVEGLERTGSTPSTEAPAHRRHPTIRLVHPPQEGDGASGGDENGSDPQGHRDA